MPSARVRMKEPNGRTFTLVENANDVQSALDALEARVAITVGTIVPGSFTQTSDGGAAPTPASGSYSDVSIKATNPEGEVVVLNLENVVNTLGNTTTGEIISPPPPALVTYLTAKQLTFQAGRFRR